jgi:hypothetical protein
VSKDGDAVEYAANRYHEANRPGGLDALDDMMGDPHYPDEHGGDEFGLVATDQLITRDRHVGECAAMADIAYIGLAYAKRVAKRLQYGDTGHTQHYADAYAICVEGAERGRRK